MQKKTLILSAVIIVVILVGGFFIYQNDLHESKIQPTNQQISQPTVEIKTVPQTTTPTPTIKPAVTPAKVVWKTFKDSYGFQMQYSPDKNVMNIPTSKIVTCDNSCPAELTVNNIASTSAIQTINGVKYCIYSGAKASTNSLYNEYLFLTVNNNTCYGLDVSYSSVKCDSLNNNTAVQSCKANEIKNQNLIYQALASIKFVKQ